MTMLVASTLVDTPDADMRWRAWQARGAEADRRRAAWLRGAALVIAIALSVWFVVPLN